MANHRGVALLAIVAAAAAAACGPSAVAPDASLCQARAAYAEATLTAATATGSGSGNAQLIQYNGTLEPNALMPMLSDLLDIELYANAGGFAGGGIVAGDYDLSRNGDNAYTSCGVCVQVWAQYNPDPNADVMVGGYYQATAGTLSLTSITPTLTGSVSGLTLKHIDFTQDPDNRVTSESDDGDNCKSAVRSADFTAAVSSH